MASEDPINMFADMKKKKKKKVVAFSEDPLGADADPTYPPPEPLEDPSLGPPTAHERALQTGPEPAAEEEDVKALFGDLKKKKKKKETTTEVR